MTTTTQNPVTDALSPSTYHNVPAWLYDAYCEFFTYLEAGLFPDCDSEPRKLTDCEAEMLSALPHRLFEEMTWEWEETARLYLIVCMREHEAKAKAFKARARAWVAERARRAYESALSSTDTAIV